MRTRRRTPNRLHAVSVLALPLALGACAGGTQAPLGRAEPVECAPFARAVTGVALDGPAAAWWAEAAGRYRRTRIPRTGDLLVFAATGRLPSGHVAVVSAVVAAREILLTQANWLHGRIGIDQPAIDVSPANDWTSVRVFWPPAAAIGRHVYTAYGFIEPRTRLAHDQIRAAARR